MNRIRRASIARIITSLLLATLCSGCVAGGRKYTIGWRGISAETTAAAQPPGRNDAVSATRQEVAQQTPASASTTTGFQIENSSRGYAATPVAHASTSSVAG